MTTVRLTRKPAFKYVGEKVWISGQDNAQFAAFWSEAHERGLVARLKALKGGNVTESDIFEVSRVENDPQNRAFYFYIAAEVDNYPEDTEFECGEIPSVLWAIFSSEKNSPAALIETEMYAFTQWLPNSGYMHAKVPELEVYPKSGGVEFWLGVEKNG